jgi:hypothetical protein
VKPNLIEIVADLVPLETTLKTITAPQNQPVCLLHPLMGRPPNKLADKLPQIDLFLFCAPIQFEAIYILCYAFLTPFLAPLLIPPPPPRNALRYTCRRPLSSKTKWMINVCRRLLIRPRIPFEADDLFVARNWIKMDAEEASCWPLCSTPETEVTRILNFICLAFWSGNRFLRRFLG